MSDFLIHLVDLLADKLSSAISFDDIIAGLSSKDGSSASEAGSSASEAATATATPAATAK
ncbi:hypothetical protein G7Y29_00235 [Corynebacterium qintianiae]|uniref:Uncharacterized protein n=1 Tax=Corynebacterium qintianiae TaxID=2709392 RepID=A0A7T0KMN0_9CORY|nr:hypothetical protein [Corynebacterium qintianiae]QPK83302.1 hypothetical protein G7Y29_00235 [Corynebacterium qintianiae]